METQWGPHGGGSGRSADGEEARALLIDAFTKVAAERGYTETSPLEVTAAAGLPPGSFAAAFGDKRRCLVAAFDHFVSELVEEVEEVIDPAAPWDAQVRAGLAAAIAFVSERAEIGRLFAVEAAAAGPAVSERYAAAMDWFAALLQLGRDRAGGVVALPPLTERVLVAGASDLVISALLVEDRERLLYLEAQLAEVLLMPYLPAVG